MKKVFTGTTVKDAIEYFDGKESDKIYRKGVLMVMEMNRKQYAHSNFYERLVLEQEQKALELLLTVAED